MRRIIKDVSEALKVLKETAKSHKNYDYGIHSLPTALLEAIDIAIEIMEQTTMNFELGKTYIVDVTENGIIPQMEFDRNKWVNKDCDDLDFLTDEEKSVIVNDIIDKIGSEIYQLLTTDSKYIDRIYICAKDLKEDVFAILDKYKRESE